MCVCLFVFLNIIYEIGKKATETVESAGYQSVNLDRVY